MTNVEASTARLSSKYKFSSNQIWTRALKDFSAALSPEAVAGLRCEPEVSYVQYIQVSQL